MPYIQRIYMKCLIFLFCILIFNSCSHISSTAHAKRGSNYFDSLQKRLIADGFNPNWIKQLYGGSQFETKGISMYFVHKESTLNYDQFLETEPLKNARKYMQTHNTAFINAENTYGVTRKVITAIILVETRLGTYVGKRSVFNTLSTMAALEDQNVRNILWRKISKNTRLTQQGFEEKAKQKSSWAYNELKAFLQYTKNEKINPLEIDGSYAGAMGICQFMPSNILILAKDGNKDQRINLFDHADAIMSVASYLKHYGWHPGIDREKAYDVVYTYNHSPYYVNTVLKIAESL